MDTIQHPTFLLDTVEILSSSRAYLATIRLQLARAVAGKPRARNMVATWPQVSRFDPVSARGCGLCQGAERSAGVSVFDEGSLIDELFVAFAVAVD